MANKLKRNEFPKVNWGKYGKGYNVGAPDPNGAPHHTIVFPQGMRACCNQCNKWFKTLNDLQKHRENDHNYRKK